MFEKLIFLLPPEIRLKIFEKMDNESLRNLSFTCKTYYQLIHDCRHKYLKLYLLRMILTNEKQTSGWMKNYINFRFPIPRTCQNLSVESLKIRNAVVDDSFCKLLRNFLIENNVKASKIAFISCKFRTKFNFLIYCIKPSQAAHISTSYSQKQQIGSKTLKNLNQFICLSSDIIFEPLSLINCIVACGEIVLEEAQTISSELINTLLKIWLTDTYCLKKCSLKTVNELDVTKILENLNVIRSINDINKTQIYLQNENTSEYLWICVWKQSFVGKISSKIK